MTLTGLSLAVRGSRKLSFQLAFDSTPGDANSLVSTIFFSQTSRILRFKVFFGSRRKFLPSSTCIEICAPCITLVTYCNSLRSASLYLYANSSRYLCFYDSSFPILTVFSIFVKILLISLFI